MGASVTGVRRPELTGVRSAVLGMESDAGFNGLEGAADMGIDIKGSTVCLLGETDCRRGTRDTKSFLGFVFSAVGVPSEL